MRYTILILAIALVLAGCAASTPPTSSKPGAPSDPSALAFHSVQLVNGGWEPGMATGPDGTLWVSTQDKGTTSTEIVYASHDNGKTWNKTASDPGTSPASADNEMVVAPSGRIFSSDINGSGVSLDIHYSDDNGQTWTASKGQQLQDQDREWLAIGPSKGAGNDYDVYMLWHNLVSGAGQHEMFVTTSHDAGANFGAPVPIAPPGSPAWLDLQCSDSGGPSDILVNNATGRIYAIFGTRTSAAGGCGASVTGQFEINVVAATRIWISVSDDHGATWTPSIAYDDSSNGKIVGMQQMSAALDRAGNVYIAFPESPKPYPDFDGASIDVIWAPADLSKWSKPIIAAAGDNGDTPGTGHILAQLVVGDPGKFSVFFMAPNATVSGADTLWYPTIAQTWNGFDAAPHFETRRVSDVASWKGTASALMGACKGALPATPLGNPAAGFTCNRSSDVYEQTLTADCRAAFVWYSSIALSQEKGGTYVATQTGGPALC